MSRGTQTTWGGVEMQVLIGWSGAGPGHLHLSQVAGCLTARHSEPRSCNGDPWESGSSCSWASVLSSNSVPERGRK